jgi:hypothetical protein
VRKGAVALGEVAARTTHIEVACTRCDRKGKYLLARLVKSLGPDFAMTDLARELTSCTRRQASAAHERCDVYFPNLVAAICANDESEQEKA